MKWFRLPLPATLLVAAFQVIATAQTSRPASLPVLLADFDVSSEDKAAIQKTLTEIPDAAATVTFRGILAKAGKATEAMKNVLEMAAEQQRIGTDDQRRRAKDLALAVAIVRYEESLDEISASLDGAKNEPLRFVVNSRAALSLAGVVPLRAKVAPVDGDIGPILDRTTNKLRAILIDLLRDGVALREKVLREQLTEPKTTDLRDLAHKYAEAGNRLLAQTREIQNSELQGDPALKKCYDWLQTQQSGHPPIAGSVAGLSNAKGVPVFAVADMNGLVPWPVALAQYLEIGHTELQWDIAGVDPIDAKPENLAVQPRLNVSVWFVLNHEAKTRLPLHSIRLRGSPVDRFTLGDDAEYRRELKAYLTDKAKDQAVLVDKGDLAAMRAVLTASPAKQHFDDFHRRVGLEVGANLGENDLTYKLIDSLWTKQRRLNREVFWLVRLPSLREIAPKAVATSTPAPVPSAPTEPSAVKAVDYSEDWRKSLDVPTSTVDPHDVDVSLINELIHRKLNRLIDEHKQATLEKLSKSDDWKTFLASEESLLAADRGGKLGVAPIQGALIRTLQDHLGETRMVLANDLRYRLPSWLPPTSRYQRDHTRLGMPPLPQPRASLVELTRAWNAGEDVANREVDPATVRGWRQFISTLGDLDQSVVGLAGESSVRNIPSTPMSFLHDDRIRGLVRPQEASDWVGDLELDNRLPEIHAELKMMHAGLDRFDDLLRITKIAIKYILDTDIPKRLVDSPEFWQEYCTARRVYAKAQDVKSLKPPAVSVPSLEASLARRQLLRNGLLKTTQLWLEDCKAEQKRLIETLPPLEKRMQDIVKARFPDKAHARGEIGELDRLRLRFQICSGRLSEMIKDVDFLAKPVELSTERLKEYAGEESQLFREGGDYLRWRKRILANLKDNPVIHDQAEVLIQDLAKKIDPEAVKSALDSEIESDVITKRTFGEILSRYGALREKGLSNEIAMYAAYSTYLADGMPLDPAIEVHQGLRLMAAEAGLLIGTPYVAVKTGTPEVEKNKKP